MGLFNTTQHPPNGWLYVQEFDGRKWSPDPMLPFLFVCDQICAMRRNNGIKCEIVDAANDLGAYTCNRLGNDPRWCQGPIDWTEAVNQIKRESCAGCGRKRS